MRRFLAFLLLLAAPATPAAPQTPAPGSPQDVARARALIENSDSPAGDLPVECWVHLESRRNPGTDTGPGTLYFEAFLDLQSLDQGAASLGSLRVTLTAATIEGKVVSRAETVAPVTVTDDGSPADAWLYRGRLNLPDDLHAAAVVIDQALGSRWGACVAELADGPLHLPAGMKVAVYDPEAASSAAGQAAAPAQTGQTTGAASAQAQGQAQGQVEAPSGEVGEAGEAGETGGAGEAPDADEGAAARQGPRGTIYPDLPGGGQGPTPNQAPNQASSQARAAGAAGPEAQPGLPTGGRLLVILPPRERPAVGKVEIQTLVTTDAVSKVAFYLDGTQVGTDDREPFKATLDLGPEAKTHTIRAVALGEDGHELGSHQITVNRRVARFDVRITGLETAPASTPGGPGSVNVAARVTVPPGGSVARVEFYRNQQLLTTLTSPPWRATLPLASATPAPDDYVRVVGYLADGSSLEDVQLLSQGVAAERVEVNLVQLFVVVTNEDGEPVQGLKRGDFKIRFHGQEQPIERFQVADDVPLTLGLLIDTSGSMDVLLTDAERAAARFLINTLIPKDRAFLVSFANRPHLLQPATGDLNRLLQRFAVLRAGGATALYDSIVFSTVQLWDQPGRRAVVLLTDGYDEGSHMPIRRVIQYSRLVGAPVYIVSLAGLYNERGSVRRTDLEAITDHTGGRVYYINDISKLAGAYDQINRELRSQYVLAFPTDHPLTEGELDEIAVKVDRKGVDVRTAVGSE